MAEFKLGRIRFIWKDNWTASTTYLKDDVIRYGGRTYVCITGHTAGSNFYTDIANWNNFSDGVQWKSDWSQATFYKINDIVRYGGIIYICNTGHTAQSTLEADQSKWDQFATSIDWKDNWTAGTVYKANDLVKYGGNIYICNTGHTAAATNALGLEADILKWDLFSEGQDWKQNWAINTRYKVNDIVKYGGTLYIANTGHTSNATAANGLEADQAKWDYLHKGIEYLGEWTNSYRYKVNDVVIFGATLYICTTQHTSVVTNPDSQLGTLQADIANWDKFVPGLEFENTWQGNERYQPGDFVTYGGNQYVANDNVYGEVPPSSAKWDLVTSGFNLRGDWGADSTNQEYRIGDVVRLGGYTYVAVANSTGQRPPNATYWARLNQGIEWKNTWTTATLYDLGDAVRYGLISYVCVQAHTSDTAKRPDNDTAGDFWNNLASGAEESSITTSGDLLYYGGSGPTRLPIGKEGQVLSVSSGGIPEWKDFGATPDVYYVATNGADTPAPTNGVTLDRPFKTIRYACEEVEKGARNANAVYLLERNRTFIAYETAKWAKRQIITQTSPFFIGFSFNEAKFQRLAGFAVDALILDLRRGGNRESRRVSQAMKDNVSGDYFDTGSESQNVAALNFVTTLMNDVITSATPSADYQALDGVASADRYLQIKDTTRPAESGASAEYTANMVLITSAITLGNGYTIPAEVFKHTIIFVKTGEYREVLPIRVPERCAVQGDELRSTKVLPAGQLTTDSNDTTYSLAGILHMKSILDDIVQGSAVTAQTGNALSQDVSKPLSTSAVATIVQELAQELYDQIDFLKNGASGDSTAPLYRGNNTRVDDEDKMAAARLLMLNKSFIARDVTKYIAVNYPSYTFDTTACERDVGHYIDGFIYDLIYPGNYKTLYNGLFYANSALSYGSARENMFLFRDATGLRNMTVSGLTGTLGSANAYGTKRPTAGAYASLDPGWGPDDDRTWIKTRSPYVQGVTTFGTACVGLKVDGNLHNGGNDSIVANDFTQVLSDGIGAWVTNLGRAELVSVFSYYGHIGYLAENGGKIRGTNGNCSYGDFGAVSEFIDVTEVPITGGVNNRKTEAQIGRALTDGSKIIHFEYTNAGNAYTNATYTISGAGYGAIIANANYGNNSIFEVRLRNPDDGSTYNTTDTNSDGLLNDPDTVGGRGYVFSENTAQGGNASTITLSNTETANSTKYVGMRVVITAGTGAGQYAQITSYNPGTKVANVAKESDGTAGWNTWHPTNGIASTLDATTTYSIEPRVTVIGGGGSGAQIRAKVSSGRITQFFIVNPGTGYTTTPTLSIVDPNETIEVPYQVRVGNGVLLQPTWTNRGIDFETAGAQVSGDGYGDIFQEKNFLNVYGLTDIPVEGSNLEIAGDSRYFKIVFVRELTGSAGNYNCNLQISPETGIESAPVHGANLTIRKRFSQVRLTGHDFLDIGTGNFASTNYPGTPSTPNDPNDEVNEFGGGRVFYTSTDQDGNFRVGRLFNVEQSTGSASLNTSAFSLAGLQELSLGAVGLGQGGATINEFSTDGTFSANSDNVVPTQAAIITYINSQIGGGSSSLNVNAVTAGKINITGNTISTTDNSPITVTTGMNFNGGVSGTPVAFAYFLTSKT